MSRPVQNPERNAEIVALRKRKWSPAEIARHLGVSRNVVIGVCHRAGLTDSNSPKAKGRGADYSAEFKAQVLALAARTSMKSAAIAWGVPPTTVQSWRGRAA